MFAFVSATVEDIPEILRICRSLIGSPGCAWNSYYPDEEIFEYDVRNNSLYVLKDGERIIACASATPLNELTHLSWKPKNPCELARVAVMPEKQGQGIGMIIMRHVMEAAKMRGFDGMVMIVNRDNPSALALYAKCGFEVCGEMTLFDIDCYCCQIML